MKKKAICLALSSSLLLLAGCSGGGSSALNVAIGDMPTYENSAIANYYLNYDKASFPLGEGTADSDTLTYVSQKISLPAKLTPPTNNPTRTGYDFGGWYIDKECSALFDFTKEVNESTYLYANWTITGEGEYVEPTYVPKSYIDDTLTSNLSIRGVLNVPINNGTYYLPTGALARLNASPNDVRFALNATLKSETSIDSAVFDNASMKITVTSSNNGNVETIELLVAKNASSSLVLANSTYENKAVAYEEKDKEAENYHVMLAGSSSIEFWESYESDLDPIVAYNHGIGGTTAKQWNESLLERLVLPYSPKAIVYYVGINDLTGGGSVDSVSSDIISLLDSTHSRLPDTHVFFVYINVLPGYFLSYHSSISSTNSNIETYMKGKDWIEGVRAGDALLKESGEADAAYFRLDCIHMSQYGYVLWSKVIKNALKSWMGE